MMVVVMTRCHGGVVRCTGGGEHGDSPSPLLSSPLPLPFMSRAACISAMVCESAEAAQAGGEARGQH